MIRLYVTDPLGAGNDVPLGADQARYLTSVMRLALGDTLAVFNGRDGEWRASIAEIAKRGCRLRIEDRIRPQEIGPDLDLIAALVKRTRLETIVEKATELGARRIRLAITQHAIADHTNVARLQAIAVESAEQTGRLDIPQVLAPERLDAIIAGWSEARRLLFCDEAGDARPVLEALMQGAGEGQAAWGVLIGPEGGFSRTERERLREQAFVVPATLGPRILRADTAAIAAMTLWQAARGDWRA